MHPLPSTSSDSRLPRRGLRVWLAAVCLGLGWAGMSASCAASFDPPSKVNALRLFSVDADKPYAKPGDTVTFKLNYADGLDRENARPIQITWLGGCFDPDGDAYYGCYAPLAAILKQLQEGVIPPDGIVAQGPGADAFATTLPLDIISRRPRPQSGPYAGTAFVFFTACAGTVKPIPPEGTSTAGSFPLGCFDDQGNRLGPDSFVVGYTQIYAFDDGRANASPTVTDLNLDGAPMSEDFGQIPHVKSCSVTADQRKQSGCAAPNAFSQCTQYKIKVQVPKDVAEIDPEGRGQKGEQLHEVVWASYFADGGDFNSDTKLISDATSGYTDTQEVDWVPPPEAGTYAMWVVVRDSRGGSTTLKRLVTVDP